MKLLFYSSHTVQKTASIQSTLLVTLLSSFYSSSLTWLNSHEIFPRLQKENSLFSSVLSPHLQIFFHMSPLYLCLSSVFFGFLHLLNIIYVLLLYIFLSLLFFFIFLNHLFYSYCSPQLFRNFYICKSIKSCLFVYSASRPVTVLPALKKLPQDLRFVRQE